jgi:Tol biopolymer transport system component
MKRLFVVVLAVLLVFPAATADAACTKFHVQNTRFQVGQAPTWTPDGSGFVYKKQVALDKVQVYTALRDGTRERCLTCALQGPNQVAHFRPQGDKILFHGFGAHQFRLFGPGFGGVGSDFFVMDPDGSHVVNLSNGAEGEDNFHAYFSPNGRQIVWTHIDWDVYQEGQGKWSVRLADYIQDTKGPRLANVRTVRPENGHFYETQWWSPNGRGFLFTESVDNAMNLELFFHDVPTGVNYRITRNPAWDEQAIFTPDGRKIIFMSTRDHPSDWQTWAGVSAALLPTADLDFLLTPPLFPGLFFSPAYPPATDLYEYDLATRKTRRLTFDGDDGWIIPEFAWDPTGKMLLWTELKTKDEVRISDPTAPGRELMEMTGLADDPPPESVGLETNVVPRTRVGRYVC